MAARASGTKEPHPGAGPRTQRAEPAERHAVRVAMPRLARHLALLIALMAALAWNAREQPLVRNGLVYARAAWNVAETGFDPRPVVADSRRSYDKPIGFAWLAAPLVARFGAHDGLRLASFAGAIAWLLAIAGFARAFLPRSAPPWSATALVWLAGFGPLLAYQSWSAHPDGWFAALVVIAMTLTQRMATGSDAGVPLRALALGAVIVIAFLLKNYALVLVPSCALHLALQARSIVREGRSLRLRVAWCGAALAAAGGFVVAARFGWNPLARMEGEGGGADQYAFAEIGSIGWKTLAQLGLALALQFNVALLAWTKRAAWSREAVLAGAAYGLPYVIGLLPFPTAFYNMRYFLPLFPLAALLAVNGAATWRPRPRLAAGIAFLALNGALTLLFNVPALFDRARPLLPDTKVAWLAGGPPLALLDNLRMEQHRDQAAWLATIDREVEPGGTLYLLDVGYYRDAQHHVFERDRFIRDDIATRYASRRDWQPSERRFWVWSYGAPPLEALQALGTVTPLGQRLFRIDAPLAEEHHAAPPR